MRGFGSELILALAGASLTPHRLRATLLKWAGVRVGDRCLFFAHIFVDFPRKITIGHNVFVNHFVHLDGGGGIVIEDGVRIGPHVRLLTSSHQLGTGERRAGPLYRDAIRVGRGSWLGASVTVLPGVSIGDGCIVAAGSVVTADCEPHTLYAGVPARAKKKLDVVNDTASHNEPITGFE